MANGVTAKKAKKDLYVNRAIQRVTMSAANTLTFQQIQFAVGVFQGVAILIHRIVYHLGVSAWDELTSLDDSFQIGITVSSQISDIAMTHIEVVDQHEVGTYVNGVTAVSQPIPLRLETDLSSLPGGGILVPANPIYAAMDSAGLDTAANCDVEMLFTFVELTDADYIELIQSRVQANL